MTEIIDNRARRIRTMKKIIRCLHQGGDPGDIRDQLKKLVQETDASEIAAMEQELINDGMPVDEVRSMCDLHAQVLNEIRAQPKSQEVPPGHPVDTFRRENEALRRPIDEMKAAVAEARERAEGDPWRETVHRMRQAFNDLMDVDKHYLRKENLLFSRLEHHGVVGPSKVMWAKHDEARQLLKRVGQILSQEDLTADELIQLCDTTVEPALKEVEGMVFKEENILFPMALDTLTDRDWGEIWRDSPQYGWCLVEPREGYRPSEPAGPLPAVEVPTERSLPFPTGNLTLDQLKAILATLPVGLTFIDAEDRVRYFSEGPERIFMRSRAILGRKVQNCHPPGSVHVVDKILSDFRSGQQNVAEFWINFRGKFIHIRYFAVRDPDDEYLGTLEATQDLTRLRALESERRLLQYDTPSEDDSAMEEAT
jgi:PAS domain S-box-containing protein